MAGPKRDKPGAPPTADERQRQLQQQRDELHDRWLRCAAELDNQRKRAERDTEACLFGARAKLLRAILPIGDHLERALEHAADGDPVTVGVRLVRRELAAALAQQGVTRFSPLGESFDPARHDAVDQLETTELPAGTVARVVVPGYLLDGRLLRPAQVIVARRPAAGAQTPAQQPRP